MAKIKKVNLLGNLPDEPGELENNFYAGPVPPAGLYKGKLKRLTLKSNKNGDPMLNGVIEIDEPKKPKSAFNGYGIWFNQNVTEQGAPYLNQFLVALGCKYADLANIVTMDDNGTTTVTKIGTKNLTGDNAIVLVTKRGEYNGTEKLDVARFVVPANEIDDDDVIDEDADEADDDDESDDDVEDADEADDDESDDDEEGDEEDEEDEEGEAYTREELQAMTIAEIRAILKEQFGWTVADWKGLSKADLVIEIVGGEDDDDDEGDDENPF